MNKKTGTKKQGHLVTKFRCESPEAPSKIREIIAIIITCLLAMVMIAACASTKITSSNQTVTEKLPRPDNIWVYDFAATDADVSADSALAGHNSEHSTPQTAHQIEMGRKLGALIAEELVTHIRDMGLQANRGETKTKPQINDIVIHGHLLSIVEGDAEKRVLIGFGSGESELKVAAEGFQMTAQGLRKIGSGTSDSEGSKSPGGVVGVAALVAKGNPAGLIIGTGMKVYGEETGSSKVEGRAKQTAKEIAEILKKRFEELGWINKE
jgi:hypothetical protein